VRRRDVLRALGAVGAVATGFAAPALRSAQKIRFPDVVPERGLAFPGDHGAHPDFRIEWWYVTGWLRAQGATRDLGFQITFFRARNEAETENPSAFTPRQILFAHAALADAAHGRLQHDQRAARAGLTLAGAGIEGTRVWIDDWRLVQRILAEKE